MAPELLDEDDARHTVYSDIWACGCLVLEVCMPSSRSEDKLTEVSDFERLRAISHEGE